MWAGGGWVAVGLLKQLDTSTWEAVRNKGEKDVPVGHIALTSSLGTDE